MKIFYTLFAAIFILATISQAQPNPGQFEIRLVSPGGEPGVMRVQYRAIGSVVPTTDNICPDLTFKLWWNVGGVTDIDVVQATSLNGQLNESTGPLAGTNTGQPGGTPGTVVAVGVVGDPFFFPENWVQGEWVNVANITICSNNNCSPAGSPAGVTAADFQIQGYVAATGSPNINIDGEDYAPTAGPLPLNLIAFNASKSGDRNSHLTWTTANEENTSHFLVQRSFDLKTWSDVGKVGAAGYSIDIRNYELNDFEVYNGVDSKLKVNYRLVMVDLDGRSKISPIKSVTFGNTSLTNREVLVYPNPASNGVYVEWDVDEFSQPTALEFYDINGKLILTQVVGEKATQEYVDFTKSTMLPGLYLLRVMKGAEPLDYKQIVVGQR